MILVLASFGAIRALAWGQADPVGAVETAYLALLVGGVLAAVAFLAPPSSHELHHAAWLAPAAAWAVGYGPHRGAVVTVVLAVALTVAAARSRQLREPGTAVAIAVGLQWLLRPDLLLPPLLDLRTLVSLAALPAAAGLALHQLTRSCGHRAAMVAGLTAVVLAPGFNVTTTLALVALAAGTLVADPVTAPLAKAGRIRWVAGLVLLVPPLWDAVLGTLFSVGGVALLLHLAPPGAPRWSDLRRYATVALGLFATFVALRGPVLHGGSEALRIWAGGLVLLPVLAVTLARRETSALAVRGIFLAFLATLASHGPDALAGGLALAALALPASEPVASPPTAASSSVTPAQAAADLQVAFSTALLVLTLALASYPWVRQEPLRDGLALIGLEHLGLRFPENLGVAGLLIVVGGAFLLAPLLSGRRSMSTAAAAALLVALLAGTGLAWSIPATALVPIADEAHTLVDGQRFHARFPPQEVSGGVLDANLIRGASLALGTPVAEVRLHDSERHLVQSWELLAGIDTGEWAAARRDIADRPGFHAPPPWLSQVAPGGAFFARRFRAHFRVSTGREDTARGDTGRGEAASVSIRRHPDLPPHVELVVYRLELRR